MKEEESEEAGGGKRKDKIGNMKRRRVRWRKWCCGGGRGEERECRR